MNEISKEDICKKNEARGWSPEVFPTLTFSCEQDSCDNYLYEAKTMDNSFIFKIKKKLYTDSIFFMLKYSLLICTKHFGKTGD